MSSRLKRVYFALPLRARSVVASAYGAFLRSWRFGGETESLVAEALQRDSWGAAEWDLRQRGQLERLLHRAATRVPHYRSYWDARRAEGDRASWLELANWPVLSKDSLRRDPSSFVVDDAPLWRLRRSSTSGTSGSPITTWQSRRTARRWYALFEARVRRWYGVDRYDRWAILGGQIVAPAAQRRPPFWVWNGPLRQLYLSTLHLAPDNASAYVEALHRFRIRYLYGYASSMYWLARMIRDRGLLAPQLAVAVSNAEPLHPYQRQLIQDVFRCPVRDTYGMSEIVAAASECECGAMHLWPDAGLVEVLQDAADRPAEAGEAGRLVCTGLLNDDMPLIRYDVGDRGALAADRSAACRCGRRLPVLARIEGRSSDNLVTADGRRVFWLNPVFYELPVREAQIVQEAIDRLRVNVVPEPTFDAEVEELIEHRLRQRMGDVQIEVQRMGRIARGPNGKFQPVVNLLDREARV